MLKEDRDEYLSVFLMDTKEYLAKMSEGMYILEENQEDKEVINNIFRAVHSIKGSAGFLEFKRLTDISHVYETLLGKVREGQINIDSKIFDDLFSAVNVIERIVDSIEKTGDEPETDKFEDVIGMDEKQFYEFIDKVREFSESFDDEQENKKKIKENKAKKEIVEKDEQKERKEIKNTDVDKTFYRIKLSVQENMPMKNVRLFILFKNIAALGELISSSPDEDELMNDTYNLDTLESVVATDKKISEIEKLLKSSDIVDSSILEVGKIEEEQVRAVDVEAECETPEKIKEEKVEKKKENVKLKEYIKIEKDKIDSIMDTVGELVIDKSRYNQMRIELKNIYIKLIEKGIEKSELRELTVFIDNFKKINKGLERAANKLQDEVTSMRIFPIKELFSRYPRTLRELAVKIGKEVVIEMHGEDTELDKMIIEGLSDPILHMLRNSVDHGIETREERIAAGKPEKGKIILEATSIGNEIIIRVSDDGKGIDANKVAQKAFEKGIITKEKLETMSAQEKIELIFLPGFSTAEVISDISGRGVGMDVVKNNIKRLKGKVDIETVVGKGSTFNIRLPLTLAITRALLINNNNNFYSIPLEGVIATVSVDKNKLEWINKKEVMRMRDKIVPVFDINDIFQTSRKNMNENVNIVVLKSSKDMYGFKVDSFLGQQEIVIKNIEGDYHKGKGIVGATILGDGKVAMVIDNNELIEYYLDNYDV